MQETKTAILEFEEVREEYRRKDAIGIPMSVREYYEKALGELRHRIREQERGDGETKLGQILVDCGALDQKGLQLGLAEQRLRGNKELLGEVLLSLELIEEEALLEALQKQVSVN